MPYTMTQSGDPVTSGLEVAPSFSQVMNELSEALNPKLAKAGMIDSDATAPVEESAL